MPAQRSVGTDSRGGNTQPTHRDRKFRVVLVDDHPIVRDGLRAMLRETEFEVCGEAESVSDAKALLREQKPDAVVVDLTLSRGDGFELVRDSRARYPQLRILVVSMQDERVYAERLVSAGANGYLMKGSAADQLVEALRRICAGQFYLSEEVGAHLLDRMMSGKGAEANPVDSLSDRELQVLNLIGRGKSSREVASELNLSQKTVESHRQSLKRKLSLDSSAQLVKFAVNWADSAGR